jgi:hypothetical protein
MAKRKTEALSEDMPDPALEAGRIDTGYDRTSDGHPEAGGAHPVRPGEYSNITINFNPGAKTDNRDPNWRGVANLRFDDGQGNSENIEYRIAAWGPNAAQNGGPMYYKLALTPADPRRQAELVSAARAARRFNGEEPPPPLNPVDGFDFRAKLGEGVLFERGKQIDAGIKADPDRKAAAQMWGYALVDLPQGPTNLALSLWHQKPGVSPKTGKRYDGFYSGGVEVYDAAKVQQAREARMTRRPAGPEGPG